MHNTSLLYCARPGTHKYRSPFPVLLGSMYQLHLTSNICLFGSESSEKGALPRAAAALRRVHESTGPGTRCCEREESPGQPETSRPNLLGFRFQDGGRSAPHGRAADRHLEALARPRYDDRVSTWAGTTAHGRQWEKLPGHRGERPRVKLTQGGRC